MAKKMTVFPNQRITNLRSGRNTYRTKTQQCENTLNMYRIHVSRGVTRLLNISIMINTLVWYMKNTCNMCSLQRWIHITWQAYAIHLTCITRDTCQTVLLNSHVNHRQLQIDYKLFRSSAFFRVYSSPSHKFQWMFHKSTLCYTIWKLFPKLLTEQLYN